MLLECEDPVQFQKLNDEYVAFYQPANPVERHLVQEIIGADWRIRRLQMIEVALVDYEMATNQEEIEKKVIGFDAGIHLGFSFKALADTSRATALLSRYESRLQRTWHRSHQAFMDLRRDIAAGLIGQPSAPVRPEPPAPPPPAPEPCQPPNPDSQNPPPNPKIKLRFEPTASPTPMETKPNVPRVVEIRHLKSQIPAAPRSEPAPAPDTLRESHPKPL
jgi:hypothetical protein